MSRHLPKAAPRACTIKHYGFVMYRKSTDYAQGLCLFNCQSFSLHLENTTAYYIIRKLHICNVIIVQASVSILHDGLTSEASQCTAFISLQNSIFRNQYFISFLKISVQFILLLNPIQPNKTQPNPKQPITIQPNIFIPSTFMFLSLSLFMTPPVSLLHTSTYSLFVSLSLCIYECLYLSVSVYITSTCIPHTFSLLVTLSFSSSLTLSAFFSFLQSQTNFITHLSFPICVCLSLSLCLSLSFHDSLFFFPYFYLIPQNQEYQNRLVRSYYFQIDTNIIKAQRY